MLPYLDFTTAWGVTVDVSRDKREGKLAKIFTRKFYSRVPTHHFFIGHKKPIVGNTVHLTNTFENKEGLSFFSKSFDDEITMLHVSHLFTQRWLPLGSRVKKDDVSLQCCQL